MEELLWMNLQSQLAAYLSGLLPLRSLEEWLVAYDPLLLASPAEDIVKIAGLLSHGIADINRGHISEDEFKEEIRQFLVKRTIAVSVGDHQVFTGSSNRNVTSGATVEVLVHQG